MSYERLNLQDFTDIWTAAHVTHVEDGIVNNETKLNTVTSNLNSTKSQVSTNTNKINDHANQINTLNLGMEDLFESEMINSITPLWHTLLSNGGEKIYPPTISFDGNAIGKTYLPLDGDGESSIGYVRIGDATISSLGVMTCGGLYHMLVQLGPILGTNFNLNLDINNMTGLQLLFASVVQGEESYEYGNEPVMIYNSAYQQLLAEASNGELGLSAFPTAFSIDRSFEFNGMIYPSGFYSIYLFMKNFIAPIDMYLPFLYVDKFWTLDSMLFRHQANMPLDYSKASNAFECFEDSIFWNGIDKLNTDIIIPADHEFSGFKCISYNPQQFLSACLSATAITWNGNTVSLEEMTLFETTYYVLANSITILPTILCGEGLALPPGVYVLSEMPPFKLQFHGVDTQKLFNKHEINPQYLPEVPEFNLAEMGMSNVSLNGSFVTLETNTTKLKFYSRKGPVRITIPTEIGEVSCLATFNDMGSTHQSVVTGYYDAIKFDTVIVFTNNNVQVGIIPVSQLA